MSEPITIPYRHILQYYDDVLADARRDAVLEAMVAKLGREDLYFLMTNILARWDMVTRPGIRPEWLYERVREVEASPNGHLDLWAREHYKSTIITFGLTIQDILKDPEETFGIFSCTRPIAKAFLGQIKDEFEKNGVLKRLYPDVLWEEPRRQAPRWSLDGGIVVKRENNPKEATIEAWGLVDGQPTSKHFGVLVYDDVVTVESVSTPEMIDKVNSRWEISLNLGTIGGKQRYIGTRYHFHDTYKLMMDRGAVKKRIYTATDDGTDQGNPVFLPRDVLLKKRTDMGLYNFGCQMLQNPKADGTMGFKEEWLTWYNPDRVKSFADNNRYIIVDPANEKKTTSDYTVMWVVGLGLDRKYRIIDGIRDKLNLTERASALMQLHRQWRPRGVGYEKYGIQADIEHIQYVQEEEDYHFEITPLGGKMPKRNRILRLVPIFEQNRMLVPNKLLKVDYQGQTYDLSLDFRDDEYLPFPVCSHDDMLDCLARILDDDLGAAWPMSVDLKPEVERSFPVADMEYEW